MNIAEQIKRIRKEKGLSQQEVADKLSMNRVQYNRIETGKSDPTMNILQRIANVLDINAVGFFEAKNNGTEVHAVNEPLLQKVRLLEELDEIQKNSICIMIDTAIANKRLKQAFNDVYAAAEKYKCNWRIAAYIVGIDKVATTQRLRGVY